MTTKIGPREQRLRDMRAAQPKTSVTTKTKPSASAAAQPKEPVMMTAAKTASKKKAKSKKKSGGKKAVAGPRASATAAPKGEGGVRAGSKLELVVGLLTRPEGCTGKEVLAITGWPSCSMPQMARAAGLVLKKEKDGSVSRYRAA